MADLPTSPTPSLPRPPDGSANLSTRQLLEELDALMQRMLALPVEQSDENAAAKSEASAPRQVGLAPVPPAQVAVAPPPVGGKPAQFVVGRETLPNKAAVDKKPALAQGEFSQPEAAPTYLPIGAEPLLPILLNRSKPGPAKPAVAVLPSAGIASKAAQAEALPKPRPAWLKPQPTALAPTAPAQYGPIARLFLVVNRIFDGCTYLLGGAGHWLRGEQGRALLGYSGLGMIIAALVWAAFQFLG